MRSRAQHTAPATTSPARAPSLDRRAVLVAQRRRLRDRARARARPAPPLRRSVFDARDPVRREERRPRRRPGPPRRSGSWREAAAGATTALRRAPAARDRAAPARRHTSASASPASPMPERARASPRRSTRSASDWPGLRLEALALAPTSVSSAVGDRRRPRTVSGRPWGTRSPCVVARDGHADEVGDDCGRSRGWMRTVAMATGYDDTPSSCDARRPPGNRAAAHSRSLSRLR